MSPDAPARARVLAKLAATIVLAGALVAGMLLPFVGGTGMAARNSASLLDALPDALTDETPAGNTRVLAADGSLITMFYRNNRTPVASDQIAPVMKQALVAIEDARFEEHNGLDVQGTLRALATNVAAGSVQEGGSTLTQQLVKQTLVQTADTPEERLAATEESVGRKLREARMALALEEEYSKDEILTRYLNLVYFGEGAYGVQAAAQRYFSVDAAALTLPQAAMLAGLVQSPSIDDPITNPENARERRNVVLRSMLGQGMVTEAEVAEISAQPVQVVQGASPANGCVDASIGGFFCSFVEQYLTQELGISQALLENGGLTIQTTLRPDVQAAGDQAVLDTVALGDPLVGAYTAVEPGTGHVLAMSNNRRFGCEGPECESVNFNVVPSKGAGSVFKVFTAAAAVERGFGPNHVITTSEPYVSRVYRDGSGPYDVVNVGSSYPNTLDMERALYMSSNTYFLALEDQLGSVEGPVRMAQRMGMHFDAANQYPADTIIEENRGSFTFGTDATSPLDLANSVATLAANGTRCEPTPVTAVLDRTGQPLTGEDGQPVVPGDACTPEAVPARVAATMTSMLRKDVEPGFSGATGTRAYVPGHQIAGKTGTNQNRDSVAFVGYTPQYAASVMVFSPLQNQDVGGFGGALGAGIWGDAMRPILSAQQPVPFPAPPAPPAPAPAPAPEAAPAGTGPVEVQPVPAVEQPAGAPVETPAPVPAEAPVAAQPAG
ncbi:transglycosylase domain-containing protein [Geodermatophilus sp. DSM 45219]|uniref:transglycosylase domain-containing protein n=1 Tax=Geodermatophilus sp. DSM 45219 TaxID=1881103 RepID=UPI00088D1ACE|nr:transglycosylase domain-containing protein [Geodermatophilus sp. DSM 45219]SDN52537.1 Membrane carboxypeptidase (penicillin-binding protein) [Geodermatophilus sp. DSM 45219]